MGYPARYPATYAEANSAYSGIYSRLRSLLGEVGEDVQDGDYDVEIGLAIRSALPVTVLSGQTWQAFYGSLSGDDLQALSMAVALLVAADAYPSLSMGSVVSSETLGDQKVSYSVSGADGSMLSVWRRRAAALLASLSFAPPKRTPGSFFGASGPTRARLGAWGCGE